MGVRLNKVLSELNIGLDIYQESKGKESREGRKG